MTADRVGWRCFDPITFKFTTEYELIFDEYSHRKRINYLREFDLRRLLMSQGKLRDMKLQTNDFAEPDAGQDAERRLYSDPSKPPDPLPRALNSGGDDARASTGRDETSPRAVQKTTGEARNESNAQGSTTTTSESGSRSAPGHLRENAAEGLETFRRGANHPSMEQTGNQEVSKAEKKSVHWPRFNLPSITTSNQHRSPQNFMGSGSRLQHSECGHITDAPTPNLDDDIDSDENLQPPIRSGPVPMTTTNEDQPVDGIVLDDSDQVELALNDAEANTYGPLTLERLEEERQKTKFDPKHPRRPLRVLPPGREEEDTDDFKAFRRYALDNNIMIKIHSKNPKAKGTASYERYERYKMATTLREVIELSMTEKTEQLRKKQKTTAMNDIKWDAMRGHILFPQHEHNSPTHFVSAAALASRHRTFNIHQLYSAKEIAARKRQSKIEDQQKLISEIEKYERSEEIEELRSLVSLTSEEMYGCLSFQKQVETLWKDDASGNLATEDFQTDAVAAAGAVEDLLTGEMKEPANYRAAVRPDHPQRAEWSASMKRERDTLESRGTWVMVPRSSIGKHKPVKCKYVYKIKRNKDGTLQFKSRLVACGYSQVEGLDFSLDETFAGVCSYCGMRFLMSLCCQKGYILSQTDITGAYLESYLTETIYMEPPPDMWVDGKPPRDEQGRELVCEVKRGLYGLKQAGHLWGELFKDFLLHDKTYNMGFTEMTGEPNMYRKVFTLDGHQEEILIGQYVDDLLIASSSERARLWFMKRLEKRFPVNPKSSGLITFDSPGLVLSMQVRYDREKGILQFNQHDAIEALAKKIDVTKKPPRSLPIHDKTDLPKLDAAEISQTDYLSVVGSCLHIGQVSRPDCAYAIGVLTRHSATPGQVHLDAAHDLVRYLYGTKDLYIQYTRSEQGNEPTIYEKGGEVKQQRTIEERLRASTPEKAPNDPNMYIDADFAGDKVTRRSTSGMICFMNGGPVSWASRLQKLCAQSTAESEIYAVTECAKEAIHLKLLCEECGIRQGGKPMTIWEDNNACIQMGHGLRGSKAAKHFEVRLRFLHEHCRDKTIEFARIATKDQLSDGLTKQLTPILFKAFRDHCLQGG